MYPHERSLVQKFQNEPFAILGINSDPKKRLQKILDDKTVRWKCVWDGGSPGGPIAQQWNVSSWPTLYLLDQNGVIRYKDVRGEQLEKAIETLVAHLKSK